jgi:hypothetical protein
MGKRADEASKRQSAKASKSTTNRSASTARCWDSENRSESRPGERVLFHVLNASAGEIRSLALPGHVFRVVALDGNPVPTIPPTCRCCGSEPPSASAIVEMKHPGVWVMGDLDDDDRGTAWASSSNTRPRRAKPQWVKPKPFRWDYTASARTRCQTGHAR